MKKGVVLIQSFRDLFSLVFLSGFLLLSLGKLVSLVNGGFQISFELVALAFTILLLGVILYFMSKSTLHVKIGKKKVSVKIAPFGITKIKFRRDRVKDLTFFTTDAITKSSGLFIHFGNRERIFNFGGNKGMTIELMNGRKFTFFSQEIYDQRHEIEDLISRT